MASSPRIGVQPGMKILRLTWTMYTHRRIPCWAHTLGDGGGNRGQAAQGSLAESLIDLDKGLLMRQIAHQAGTTCFSDVTPFQTSPGAHRPRNGRPICACVCVSCVFVGLSLVITLKKSQHWLKMGPSGSPWPRPVGGKTWSWWAVNFMLQPWSTSEKMSKYN